MKAEKISTNAISAAEFVKHFARCREEANQHPVFISNHNRLTHVLMGMADYERMAGSSATLDGADKQCVLDVLAEFSVWIEVGMIICDADMRIRHANPIAAALCRSSKVGMIGSNFIDLPGVHGSLLETIAVRARESNRPAAVEIPSPMAINGWIRFRVIPWRDFNILILQDITPELQSQRMTDVKSAIQDAMALHGEIGTVRVSVRGTAEQVDAAMCDFIGLPENRILGVPISDLVDIGSRVEFRNALEKVLHGEGSQKLPSRMISNRGKPLDVQAAIVPLQGTYGMEGAVILLTPDSHHQ